MQKQLKMESPKRIYKFNYMRTIIFLLALCVTPQYLRAQTYQQDTATIKSLLVSAKSKRFSDSATAKKEAHQALSLAQKHNDSEFIYDAYHRLARIEELNSENQKANRYFKQELAVVDLVNNDTKRLIYGEVSESCMNIGDYKTAFELITKCYELGTRVNNTTTLQQSCLSFGSFYTAINDFEKATQYLVKSVEYSLKIGNTNQICDSYLKLSNVYLKSKNFDLAIKNVEKAMFLIEKVDNYTFPHYYIYQGYGQTLSGCGKYQEAIAVLEKALEMSKKEDDKSTTASIYIDLADIYNQINDYPKAEKCYSEGLNLNTALSNLELMSYQNGYGVLLTKQGKYDKAIIYLKKSEALADLYNSKVILQKNYASLSLAYEKKGDKSQSLLCLKKSVALQDSIFSEDNTKRIAEAQFKYDLKKSEEQVTTMKERQFTYGAGGIFLISVILIAFLVFYSKSKEEKNKLLTSKNQEIKGKNRQLEESNEILRQFAFASAHDLKEPLRSINSFVNILQKRYMKDVPVEAHEYMGFVTTGVRRMESLLNALLEFSSVLTDDNIASKKNDVPTVLKDVFHHYENLINEKKAVIRYPSVFPEIFMSETHLKQILFNVVNNALKFSKEEAKIEIGFDNRMDELIIFVKDEGIGMDKSYSDKIFKLFQRLDKTAHKESAGIGLTICKNIVDKYAGRLWFESVVNEGTTFYIAFPKSMISDVPISGKGAPQYLEVKGAVLEAHLSA
jgi:signal transduction histidine kinase